MSPDGPTRSLITGGAGFIGSHVVDALLERGDRVEVIDDLSTGSEANLGKALVDGARLHRGDLSEPGLVEAIASELRPHRIFHLAAQADVRKAVADPLRDAMVNVCGTINVLQAARAQGSRLAVAATGGAVYGEGEGRDLPLDEGTEAAPAAPYGASKLAGEVYLDTYRRLYGLPGTALRFANVYGPRQDPYGEAGVVAIFCGKMLAGESPTVFGDGLQTRDYVYVADVVDSMLAADRELERRGVELGGPFNVGTGHETSVLDLLAILEGLSGGGIDPVHAPARPGEVQRIAIDPTRAQRELGWSPGTSLRDGLERTLASIRGAGGAAAGGAGR